MFMGYIKGAQSHPALLGQEAVEGSPWKALSPLYLIPALIPSCKFLSELEGLSPSTALICQPKPGATTAGPGTEGTASRQAWLPGAETHQVLTFTADLHGFSF